MVIEKILIITFTREKNDYPIPCSLERMENKRTERRNEPHRKCPQSSGEERQSGSAAAVDSLGLALKSTESSASLSKGQVEKEAREEEVKGNRAGVGEREREREREKEMERQ